MSVFHYDQISWSISYYTILSRVLRQHFHVYFFLFVFTKKFINIVSSYFSLQISLFGSIEGIVSQVLCLSAPLLVLNCFLRLRRIRHLDCRHLDVVPSYGRSGFATSWNHIHIVGICVQLHAHFRVLWHADCAPCHTRNPGEHTYMFSHPYGPCSVSQSCCGCGKFLHKLRIDLFSA